jgi:3-phenylpropionate/trans-cinnamate dioxygenase ferredoxin component
MKPGFVPVAEADELKPAQMKKIRLNGKRLLLCNSDGKFFCVDEMCSHEDYSLELGCIRDGRIKCSLHGSWFSLETGEPLAEPADAPIRTYPVRVEDGKIWVAA